MTAHDVRQANQALLDTAARLVDELHDVPAGRVLRCFSRAVGHVRREGCPPHRLAAEAESLARAMLAGEVVLPPGVRQHSPAETRVPRPRAG